MAHTDYDLELSAILCTLLSQVLETHSSWSSVS